MPPVDFQSAIPACFAAFIDCVKSKTASSAATLANTVLSVSVDGFLLFVGFFLHHWSGVHESAASRCSVIHLVG